jgi:hypothetical protein
MYVTFLNRGAQWLAEARVSRKGEGKNPKVES